MKVRTCPFPDRLAYYPYDPQLHFVWPLVSCYFSTRNMNHCVRLLKQRTRRILSTLAWYVVPRSYIHPSFAAADLVDCTRQSKAAVLQLGRYMSPSSLGGMYTSAVTPSFLAAMQEHAMTSKPADVRQVLQAKGLGPPCTSTDRIYRTGVQRRSHPEQSGCGSDQACRFAVTQ